MNIPKILHYVWFGPRKDEKTERCIESWRIFFDDFEIVEWNETNIPADFEYLNNALRLKNWANASNFIRVWALKNFGGIYFDTDFEVIKKFDFLENINSFIGFESEHEDLFVNNAVCGSIKDHHFINDCFNELLKNFDGSELANLSSPILASTVLKRYGLKSNNVQVLNDVNIFTREYFHPYDPNKFFLYSCVKNSTYGIHHWSASWIDKNEIAQVEFITKELESIKTGKFSYLFYIKIIVRKILKKFRRK